MARIIKIKNVQSFTDVYCGQEVLAGEYYQLEDTEFVKFATDQKVQNHMSSDPVKLLVNDGTSDLAYLAGKNHLEGNTPQDSEGTPIFTTKAVDAFDRPQFRRIVTRPDWLYSPHSLDWTTAKADSLYNRTHYGNTVEDSPDVGDAWMNFYDASGNELVQTSGQTPEEFQVMLNQNCTKTVVSFEKTTVYDIQAATLYLENEPTNRAYLWCIFAPDIPEQYGGSKAFMGRGMNLRMMAAKMPHIFDAVSASTVTPDPVYHSGKLACVIKHAVGEQIGIQVIFMCYGA